MSELFHTLGIDWRLLMYYLLNFAVLVFILQRYAFKPILAALKNREQRIARSMQDAAELERRVQESQKELQATLAKAQTEAQAIVESSRQQAADVRTREVAAVQQEIEHLRDNAKRELTVERDEALQAVRQAATQLVLLATEKVTHGAAQGHIDKAMVEKTVQELEQVKV